MRIAVIGAGAMGRWCARALAMSKDVSEIVVGDLDEAAARRIASAEGGGKAQSLSVDAMDPHAVCRALEGCDAVINAAQHYCVLTCMKGALEARVPYTDLGGFFHLTRKQFSFDGEFRQAGVPAVIAMGSAPGITNVLARYGANRLDTVEEVHARCGSLDWTDWSGYQGWTVPYSIETLCDEFSAPAVQWIDGDWREVPAASGEEECDFGPPLGTLRAYATLHSEIATFVHSWGERGLKTATWKLALPPRFTEQMRFLTRLGLTRTDELRLGDSLVRPRGLLAALVKGMAPPTVVPNDVEILMSIVRGRHAGSDVEWRVRAVVQADASLGAAAGDLDTGVPPTIVARMLARGEIEKAGVWAPEEIVDPSAFFKELGRWGIVVEASSRERLGGGDMARSWQHHEPMSTGRSAAKKPEGASDGI